MFAGKLQAVAKVQTVLAKFCTKRAFSYRNRIDQALSQILRLLKLPALANMWAVPTFKAGPMT